MDGRDVEAVLALDSYDAVILDLTLPGADGMTILRQLRRNRQDLPVLVTTAKAEIDDKVSLLDLGADDYLVKPHDMRELEARLRALVRQARGAGRIWRWGGLQLDPGGHVIAHRGRLIDLDMREFRLLEALMARPGQFLSYTTEKKLVKGVAHKEFDEGLGAIAGVAGPQDAGILTCATLGIVGAQGPPFALVVLLAFGLAGFLMRRFGFPLAPGRCDPRAAGRGTVAAWPDDQPG